MLDQIATRLRAAKSLLILTHARPDGDGLGAMAALLAAARAAGRSAHALVPGGLPVRYDFLFPHDRPAGGDQAPALAAAADLIVILDTCSYSQLDGLESLLAAHAPKIVVLDHHATYDPIGSLRWIDPTAAAAGVMTGELIEALGWPLDAQTAEALLTAVTTDTGWLRYANTDARALRAVARWLDAGVRTDVLYQKLYQTDRPERLLLTIRMLESLELHAQGRLAAMCIRRTDFTETGATYEETENLVNEALRLKTVETALLLVEQEDMVRVSLRSRDVVNVAAVAKAFGGGGHPRAAGLRSNLPIDELKSQLVAACLAELQADRTRS